MAQDPAQGEPIDAAHDRVSQVVGCAKHNGLVIECTGAAGERTAFVNPFGCSLWVCKRRLAGETDTFIVDNAVDETIRNTIVACRPDVQLVEEEKSLFGVNR